MPWRPDILAVLSIAALVYARGWTALRRAGYRRGATWPRCGAYIAGLTLIAGALVSPLAVYQGSHLSLHMIQHELLMIGGAPLILLGRPFPFITWGVPRAARRWFGCAFRRHALARRSFDALTRPSVAWILSTAVLWVWHAPVLYDAVEASPILHDAQHVSFFLAGLLFWWPILESPPFRHRLAFSGRVAYLVAGMSQRSVLGGIIALSDRVLYTHYADLIFPGSRPPLADQRLAGGIMWFGSGVILLCATLLVIGRSESEISSDVLRPADASPGDDPRVPMLVAARAQPDLCEWPRGVRPAPRRLVVDDPRPASPRHMSDILLPGVSRDGRG